MNGSAVYLHINTHFGAVRFEKFSCCINLHFSRLNISPVHNKHGKISRYSTTFQIFWFFYFAFSFQITLQEIISLLNVSRFMQHLVKLHIKTLIYITSMIIPPNCIFLVAELIFLNMWHLIEILLFSSSLTKKMPTCVNFLKNVKCITASLNVCPSPLKALLSGLFCLQLFSGTPLNRTGPPNHFLLNYLFLSSYLTSISFCFLDKCI